MGKVIGNWTFGYLDLLVTGHPVTVRFVIGRSATGRFVGEPWVTVYSSYPEHPSWLKI